MVIDHNFNVNIANKCGMTCAVLLQNIIYWVDKNKANNVNYNDGCYWTYNSNKAFAKIFTYLTAKQIRSALTILEDEGLIKTGNYNKGCDRTLWYTYTEKAINIMLGNEETISQENNNACESVLETPRNDISQEKTAQNCQIVLPSRANGNIPKGQMETPSGANIPDNKPQIINSDNKLTREKEINKEKETLHSACVSVFDFWNSKDLMKCETLTPELERIIASALKQYTVEEIQLYISRYDDVLNNKDYFFSNPWHLGAFIKNGNAMRHFTDTGEKWVAYQIWLDNNQPNKCFIRNNYTPEQIRGIITNLDDVVV